MFCLVFYLKSTISKGPSNWDKDTVANYKIESVSEKRLGNMATCNSKELELPRKASLQFCVAKT